MFARSSIRGPSGQSPSHGSSSAERDAVGVLADDELLRGAAQARLLALGLGVRGRPRSRRRTPSVRLEPLPRAGSGKSSANGRTAKPSVPQRVDDALLGLVELRALAAAKRRRLARFAPTRSWSLYVATTPAPLDPGADGVGARGELHLSGSWRCMRRPSTDRLRARRRDLRVPRPGRMALRTKPRAALVHARTLGRRAGALAGTEVTRARLAPRRRRPRPLPRVRAAAVGRRQPVPARARARSSSGAGSSSSGTASRGGTPACLFNSFNFDFRRLRRFAREGVRMVHRVDGPIGVYRGFDDGTDAADLRAQRATLADATVVPVAVQPRRAPRARARARASRS